VKINALCIVRILLGAGILILIGCSKEPSACGEGAGNILDEALCVGRKAESFPSADEDYFRDMDYGLTKDSEAVAAALEPYVSGLSPKEAVEAVVKGRNNWIVWTAGNDRLWDLISRKSLGTLDLLKVISNYPNQKFSRDNRWHYLGLVNEPCFEKGNGPRKDRAGLWLDVRQENCPADPFEDEKKYPGVQIGARGKNMPVGSYYGYATGVVGLRLFPNPDFDEKAQERWDPERYYTDPSYYNDKSLVKPYRVGMSCGFCHVGPNPTNPPKDPEHPKWENLNSNPGAQYFWVDRIFSYEADPSSFPYQLFHTARPGGLDTSLISTDYINNPRTMNAIYNVGPRLINALKFGQEELAGGSLNNAQFNDYVPQGSSLTQFFKAPNTVWTPHVLKDGADSVGALGALNRVFVNIGLFSEEWLKHFNPLVGGKKISPFKIETARKNSAYWVANEMQTPDLALFFLASAKPDYLKNAPGGEAYLTDKEEKLASGKMVFAERCARCHSSKLPEKAYSFFANGKCAGSNYMSCWNKYWAWTKTDEFKNEIKEIVQADDFLRDNFLSTDLRVPVTLLETNACSPLATNAIAGDIWDNFSSESYKNLPSVGTITVHNPITGEPWQYEMPAGGRGYTRPASLISLWSTAPYLLNNTVGKFYWTGSVEDRMKSFDDSIQKMLWPEKREGDRMYVTASGKEIPGVIDVTTERSYLRVPVGYLPGFLQPLAGVFHRWLPWLFGEDGVEIGPIPKGTPVNLISNIDLEKREQVLPLLIKLKKALKSIPAGASDAEAINVFNERNLSEDLLKVNKCPDFVVNRGHYFGTDYFKEESGLSDNDKWALIEFLKTM
jgi:hypothetical protein